jgi:hypothetical protein
MLKNGGGMIQETEVLPALNVYNILKIHDASYMRIAK